MMPGRNYSAVSGYRYGFNGQEKSTEFVTDNFYTAQYWEYDSKLGRRWNVDPKPTVGFSDYSVFFNNPNKFIDVTGLKPTDDYYSKSGKYLGSDGSKTKEMRIISADKYYEISSQNNGTTSDEATKQLQTDSKIITVKIGNGSTTEGQYFQDLFNSGNGDGKTYRLFKEMSTTLLLDPANATLTVYTNSSIHNGPQISFVDDPNTIPGVKEGKLIKLGDAHTHQVADILDERNRNAEVQLAGDGKAAGKVGLPLFTIDSENIDAFIPKKLLMGPTVLPKDNIGVTSDLYDNKFSILRTALEYFGGKL